MTQHEHGPSRKALRATARHVPGGTGRSHGYSTGRELDVLKIIADASPSPVSPDGLAKALGTSKGNARQLAGQLAGRGLVRRHRAYGNGRVDYTITDAGLGELASYE